MQLRCSITRWDERPQMRVRVRIAGDQSQLNEEKRLSVALMRNLIAADRQRNLQRAYAYANHVVYGDPERLFPGGRSRAILAGIPVLIIRAYWLGLSAKFYGAVDELKRLPSES